MLWLDFVQEVPIYKQESEQVGAEELNRLSQTVRLIDYRQDIVIILARGFWKSYIQQL